MPPTSHARRNVAIVLAVALVVVVGVAVGVSDHNPSTPSQKSTGVAVAAPRNSATPVGFKRFADVTDGFSISVPQSWTDFNPDSPQASSIIERLESSDSKWTSVLGSSTSLTADGVRFMAIDPVSTGSSSPDVDVVVKADPSFSDSQLSQLGSTLESEYAGVGAKILGYRVVTLAGYEALRVNDVISLSGVNRSKDSVRETQYFLGSAGNLYVITVSGSGADLGTIPTTFRTS